MKPIFFIITILYYSSFSFSNNTPKIIKKVVSTYQKKTTSLPFGVLGCYSEEAKIDDEYVAYTDAVGLLLHHGQNCYIPLNAYTFSPISIRKGPHKEKWLEVGQNNYVNEDNPMSPPPNGYQPEYVNLLNAFRRFELYGPLNPRIIKNYDFNIGFQNSHHIEFEFEANDQGIKSGRNFKGKLYVNKTNLHIDSVYLDKGEWYSQQFGKVTNGWLIVRYNDLKKCFYNLSGGYKHSGICLRVQIMLKVNSFTFFDLTEQDFDAIATTSINPISNYKPNLHTKSSIPNWVQQYFNNTSAMNNHYKEVSNNPYYSYFHMGIKHPNPHSWQYVYTKNRISELTHIINTD